MNRRSTMKWCKLAVMFVFAVLLGLPQESQAEILVLEDDTIAITKTWKIVKGDTLKLEVDSIVIDSISLTYSDRVQDTLYIKCNEDTIFNAKLKNCLSLKQIKDANNEKEIVLKAGSEYTFIHDQKQWEFVFTDSISSDSQVSTPDGNDKNNDESKSENNSNIRVIVILIVLCLIVGAVVFRFRKKFSQLIRKCYEIVKKPKKTPPIEPKEPKDHHTPTKEEILKEDIRKLKEQLSSIETKVNEIYQICHDSDASLYIEEKLNQIKIDVSSGKDAIDFLNIVKKSLPEAKSNGEIVHEIEKLKKATNAPQPKEKENTTGEQFKEAFAQECVDKVKESKNKALQALIKKAEDDVGEKGNPTKVMEKFLKLLESEYKENIPKQGTQSLEITDKQLSDASNRRKIMKWCIDGLNRNGYKDFDKSKNNLIIDDFFSKLADLLNQAKSPRQSDEEIITKAIKENSLTDEQKDKLLKGLIEIMNKQLDESHKLTDKPLKEFVDSMVAKIQMPDTQEEATKQERQRNLTLVNSVLGSKMEQLDENGLQSALANVLLKMLKEKITELKADSYDDALKELCESKKQSKELVELLEKFKVGSPAELPNAIRVNQYKSMRESINDKLEKLLPNKPIDSVQKLVNALIKLAEDSKDEVSKVTDDLDEELSKLDNSHKTGKTLTELLDRYTSLLNGEIQEKKNEVNELKEANAESEKEIQKLKEKNDSLMSTTQSMLSALHSYADTLGEWGSSILSPCSDKYEKQCENIENNLYESLEKLAKSLKDFTVPDGTTPAEAKKEIQKKLEDIVKQENSPINTICRYYAYSRLPFMTDNTRKYGVMFNRFNMSELYAAVNNLFVAFGISFDIPALFVMGIDETSYKDRTGEAYSDLDNLCPNSCNHVEHIDTHDRPDNVVVDIVNVGYTVEREVKTKTSVLTSQ